MPFIFPQLKTICARKTTFLALSMFLSSVSWGFDWPFNTDEFQKKLESHDLTSSTRYFARGPTYLAGQKWSEDRFKTQLQSQNYRIREPDEILLAGDAKKVSLEQCRALTNTPALAEGSFCWTWQNHQSEIYLVVINPQSAVESTWAGDPVKPYWKASLDPILVAQYRGQQPIMQNELKISDFPVNCLNATMAIEDAEFLEHSGVSYMGLTRSLIKNVIKMRYAQGGSTITQQVVKNYFLTPEKTMKRKLKELYLAVKLESEWTKDQILETYLNINYMGQVGAFQVMGFGAAANYYFNKPVQQLNLGECALLAAIINNPVTNNPWKNAEKAGQRRHLVLTKMKELKLINENEFAEADKQKLPEKTVLKASETAPYFFEAVRQQITELKLQDSARSIYTSLDLDLQQAAQNALQNNISALEKNKKNITKNKEAGSQLQGLVVSTENKTGLINVFVGGQSYRQTQFNRALNARRQIGSLIKPVIYLLALENGFEPTTILHDVPFTWKYERDTKSWSPINFDKKFRGDVPMYYALKESLNSPTAQLAQKVGLEPIINQAHELGLVSKIEAVPATSLGVSTHYPIEVVDTFRTYANLGQHTSSSFIEKIQDEEAKNIFEYNPVFTEKIEPKWASVLVGMMKETLRSGTAKASGPLGWKMISAGKTGTTSDSKDAWFSAFTPFVTSVVWLGYDQSLSSQLTGATGAVPIWVDFMKPVGALWTDQDFKFAETVEPREIDLFSTDKKTTLLFPR